MATVAQIISFAREVIPQATTAIIADALCIPHINDIAIEEYLKLGQLEDYITTDKSITTVANQIEYDLPNKCSLKNIESVKVYISADYPVEYELADNTTDLSCGNYYRYGSLKTKIKLLNYGVAISAAGLEVEIEYYPTPTALTLVTQTPELDELYHSLIKYRFANRLASFKEVVDIDAANHWQAEYDNYWNAISADMNRKKNKAVKTIKNVYGGW